MNGITLCVPPKLHPKQDVTHCTLDKSWMDVKQNRHIFRIGGLGRLMRPDEWKVWVCGAELPCALGTGDSICFTYNEIHEVFVPWGYNRDLRIV